tara:strand:- start:1987 stop:2184 length:198 start_codon:yes stop_codon:yes gene_type:complete
MTKLKKGLQRQELIEALIKFAEQTGNAWYEWNDASGDVELCVVFTVPAEDGQVILDFRGEGEYRR